MQKTQRDSRGTKPHDIAVAFVEAREQASSFDVYPGELPQTLDAAYAIQNDAIGLFRKEIIGWKVGRITGGDVARFGVDRLAGPIFGKTFADDGAAPIRMPMFRGGFGAVEGEIVFILGADAPSQKTSWSTEEAWDLVGSTHVGIEIASSPFSGINDHGPLVTISDFGNNHGLIVGPRIDGARHADPSDWYCETFVDGASVGAGRASDIPGGPIESLRFLLENTASRGMPLRKGMAVSTGAISGVHKVETGQSADVRFGQAELRCVMFEAKAG